MRSEAARRSTRRPGLAPPLARQGNTTSVAHWLCRVVQRSHPPNEKVPERALMMSAHTATQERAIDPDDGR